MYIYVYICVYTYIYSTSPNFTNHQPRNTQETTSPNGHSTGRDRDSRVTLPTRVPACTRPPCFPLRCRSLRVSADNPVWLHFALLCFVDNCALKIEGLWQPAMSMSIGTIFPTGPGDGQDFLAIKRFLKLRYIRCFLDVMLLQT